jgi:prepilin-type N-terminal cleavage/methylation domain-containing protein
MKILAKLKRLLEKQGGFTLVELLVSIVILAVGIIGIMSLFPQSYSHIGNAGHVSRMNHIGQMKLDQLKTLSYSHVDLTEGMHTTAFGNYTLTWDVDEDQPTTDMKKIRLEIGHQLYDMSEFTTLPFSSVPPLSSSEAMNQKAVNFETYLARP